MLKKSKKLESIEAVEEAKEKRFWDDYPKTIDILGTPYTINFANYDEDPAFKDDNAAGFCNSYNHNIVICKIESFPKYNPNKSNLIEKEYLENAYKETIRHEVMHAYFHESGLHADSNDTSSWAMNEEMIDWLAIQLPKVFKTFEDLNVL